MKIKRLNPERWMKNFITRDENEMNPEEIASLEKRFLSIPPIIGKDGYYLDKDRCWFEYQGKAHLCSLSERKMFIHCLKTLNASEADVRAIFHIRKLIPMGYATKGQKELVTFWLHWQHLKNIRRGILRQLNSWDRTFEKRSEHERKR